MRGSGFWPGLKRFPILNQTEGDLLPCDPKARWKSESKAEPKSLQLVSLPPAVRLPSTFHTSTRLNLKTRWLCHSHGSNSCNNILKLKIKHEPCLLTLSFSLFHEHKTPSSLCVQKAWGRPVLPAKAPSDSTCAGRPLWLCPEDARFPSAVPSQTEESSNSQRQCRMTVSEWQSQILVPDLLYIRADRFDFCRSLAQLSYSTLPPYSL